MTKVDFFGHWFYFFLFIGMLLLQSKDYRGWAFRFAGEVGWIGIGFMLGMSSVWAWGFVFMAVDVLGYFKWQKEQEELAWVESANEYLGEVFPEEEIKWSGTVSEEKVETNGTNKTSQRKAKGKKVSARNSKADNRKIQPRRGRRSKPSNGKRRGGSNDEPSSKTSVPRKRRVQKNSSRSGAQGSRASKI